MSLPKVYVEPTIPSDLTARRSRELQLAADQQATEDWWNDHRQRYDCFVSRFVLAEVGRGDPVFAASRIEKLRVCTVFEESNAAKELTRRSLGEKIIPARAPKTRRTSAWLRPVRWTFCSLGIANISTIRISFGASNMPAAERE